MVQIYIKTNTDYSKNGDMVLKPHSCTYKDSENELTLEHFLDKEERWKYIETDNVISVQDNGKNKLYRIYNVIKSLYLITAYARPLFYDLVDSVLLDTRPTNKSGQEALDIILNGTGFKGHSNISTINTSYLVRKNIVEAILGDDENSFINRWGGEFYCENFDIYINDRIGSDNGLRVEFGYNLNEIEEEVNTEEVVTRIIPVAYDGIMLDGNSPWVDSPLINKYTHPKMRVIEFSDVKVKEDTTNPDEEGFNTIEEARAELKKRCETLFSEGIDQPLVNYKIDMINLANTTAYKDFKDLVNVNKGDVVTCYIPYLDIDVMARVVDFEKDMLTGEYISLELGNVINNFMQEQVDIQHRLNSILTPKGQVKTDVLNGTINALNVKFKALKDVAQPQDVLGMIFEDRVLGSKTFGCVAIGTQGLMLADKFKPNTQDWDFRTFITGSGAVADYIVTGTLLADLIKAGLLESVNGLTWIHMEDGTFNFGDKIEFDGTNLLINAKNFQTDAQGNMSFTGRLQPYDNQLKLFGNDCKIDGSGNAIRLQFNPQIYVSVDITNATNGSLRFFNQHSNNGNVYITLTYNANGEAQLFNSRTMLKLANGNTPEIQCKNINDNAFGGFRGNAFTNTSSKKYKTNIKDPDIDFIKILKENQIKTYQLKDSIESGDKLGFILEDLTEEVKRYINPNNTDGIDVYAMVSMLWGIVQEQQKQIDELKGGTING